ncbi:MAG: hypothetical protein DRJ64_08915 [Thermoprotei archaeon]|nr:MAG: hypothetical protein DRJ64_08915 [Thermoprotei archaeon]
MLDDYTDTWTYEMNKYPDERDFIKITECTAEATALGQRLKCKDDIMIPMWELKVSIYNGLSFIDLEMLVDWHEKHGMTENDSSIQAKRPDCNYRKFRIEVL